MAGKDTNRQIQGKLYIISAPSGAGKTSLLTALLEDMDNITVSVSHTTRNMRIGEEDGVHYHFVDVDTFNKMNAEGKFLESAQVFDNYYGTSAAEVDRLRNSGQDVILEIDWQGALLANKKYPDNSKIFILPPDKKALRERLKARGQDDDEVIERRTREAVAEMSHYTEFDYLVINDDFFVAIDALKSIITANRLRMEIQVVKLNGLLKELLD